MKSSSALPLVVPTFSLLALSLCFVTAAEEIKFASTGPGVSTLPLEIAAAGKRI
jgi:hypothetical protein